VPNALIAAARPRRDHAPFGRTLLFATAVAWFWSRCPYPWSPPRSRFLTSMSWRAGEP